MSMCEKSPIYIYGNIPDKMNLMMFDREIYLHEVHFPYSFITLEDVSAVSLLYGNLIVVSFPVCRFHHVNKGIDNVCGYVKFATNRHDTM